MQVLEQRYNDNSIVRYELTGDNLSTIYSNGRIDQEKVPPDFLKLRVQYLRKARQSGKIIKSINL